MATLFVSALLYFICIFLYLFFYWKRLKEDYTSNIIFSSGFLILFFFAIPLFIMTFFANTGAAFWAAAIGFLLAVLYIRRSYRLRFFELLEASGMGMLIFFFAYCIHMVLKSGSQLAGIMAGLIPVVFLFYFYTNRNYKKFNWYKSGRVGFSGLASLGLYFLLRCVIVVVSPPAVVSLSASIVFGKPDAIISVLLSLSLFFCLYQLSKAK